MKHKTTKRKVIRVDQSPMNPMRWLLTLSCGHDVWCTAFEKPTAKLLKCSKCAAEALEGES